MDNSEPLNEVRDVDSDSSDTHSDSAQQAVSKVSGRSGQASRTDKGKTTEREKRHTRAFQPSASILNLPPLSAEALQLGEASFDRFCEAPDLPEILASFNQLCDVLGIAPRDIHSCFPLLRNRLRSWKARSLLSKLEKKACSNVYRRGQVASGTRVLVVGAGPCGLRTAIECALLGARCCVVEKRSRFTRNNVVHIWPFVIADLKALGAKSFYGRFAAGSIEHISIKRLQMILLKVALLLGVDVQPNVAFTDIIEPQNVDNGQGVNTNGTCSWRAICEPQSHPVNKMPLDVLVGADGRRNTLHGFQRKEFRGRLAIAITCNFVNHHTREEATVPEISGVSRIFKPHFFQQLNDDTGIDLENIVYYKDDTHYFVMTASKTSLLAKHVLKQDYAEPGELLAASNVDRDALLSYAHEACNWSMSGALAPLEWALNQRNEQDVAMFDFTCLHKAVHASLVRVHHAQPLLMTLVGDSLCEPFWPIGSGIGRGFLGALDAAWLIRDWFVGQKSRLQVLAEREFVYQLLSQSSDDNLNKQHAHYTIQPRTRYPLLDLSGAKPEAIAHLVLNGDVNDPRAAAYNLQLPVKNLRVESDNVANAVVHVEHDELLRWLQIRTQRYAHRFTLRDLLESWRDGVALCALVHLWRPDLVNMDSINESNQQVNLELAFELSEQVFGFKPSCTIEDAVAGSTIFANALVDFLERYFHLYKDESVKMPELALLAKRKTTVKTGALAGSHKVGVPKPFSGGVRAPFARTGYGYGYDGGLALDALERSTHSKQKRVAQEESSSDVVLSQPSGAKSGKVAGLAQLLFGGGSKDKENKAVPPRESLAALRSNPARFAKTRELLLQSPLFRPTVSRVASREPEKPAQSQEQESPDRRIEKLDANLVKRIEEIITSKGTAQDRERCTEDEKPVEKLDPNFLKRLEDRQRESPRSVADDEKPIDKLDPYLLRRIVDKQREANRVVVSEQRSARPVSAILAVGELFESGAEERAHAKRVELRRAMLTGAGSTARQTHCLTCAERVFPAERMTVDGFAFHRGCFRCFDCACSLRLGTYVLHRDEALVPSFFCVPHSLVHATQALKPASAGADDTPETNAPEKSHPREADVASSPLLTPDTGGQPNEALRLDETPSFTRNSSNGARRHTETDARAYSSQALTMLHEAPLALSRASLISTRSFLNNSDDDEDGMETAAHNEASLQEVDEEEGNEEDELEDEDEDEDEEDEEDVDADSACSSRTTSTSLYEPQSEESDADEEEAKPEADLTVDTNNSESVTVPISQPSSTTSSFMQSSDVTPVQSGRAHLANRLLERAASASAKLAFLQSTAPLRIDPKNFFANENLRKLNKGEVCIPCEQCATFESPVAVATLSLVEPITSLLLIANCPVQLAESTVMPQLSLSATSSSCRLFYLSGAQEQSVANRPSFSVARKKLLPASTDFTNRTSVVLAELEPLPVRRVIAAPSTLQVDIGCLLKSTDDSDQVELARSPPAEEYHTPHNTTPISKDADHTLPSSCDDADEQSNNSLGVVFKHAHGPTQSDITTQQLAAKFDVVFLHNEDDEMHFTEDKHAELDQSSPRSAANSSAPPRSEAGSVSRESTPTSSGKTSSPTKNRTSLLGSLFGSGSTPRRNTVASTSESDAAAGHHHSSVSTTSNTPSTAPSSVAATPAHERKSLSSSSLAKHSATASKTPDSPEQLLWRHMRAPTERARARADSHRSVLVPLQAAADRYEKFAQLNTTRNSQKIVQLIESKLGVTIGFADGEADAKTERQTGAASPSCSSDSEEAEVEDAYADVDLETQHALDAAKLQKIERSEARLRQRRARRRLAQMYELQNVLHAVSSRVLELDTLAEMAQHDDSNSGTQRTKNGATRKEERFANAAGQRLCLWRFHAELLIKARDLQLEDERDRLEAAHAPFLLANLSERPTAAARLERSHEERELLRRIVNVVDERDQLAAQLDLERMREHDEDQLLHAALHTHLLDLDFDLEKLKADALRPFALSFPLC